MEQWANLLVQVAKPVVKTLVYAGTSSLLDKVQAEIKNEQQNQVRNLLNFLGIEDFIEIFRKLNEFTDSDAQEQRLESENLAFLQIAERSRQTMLQLPEIYKILEHWPLRLLPAQLLDASHPNGLLPLRIFLSPPQFPSDRLEAREIEQKLAQQLRKFLNQYYPLHSQDRPTEFLDGVWKSQGVRGECSVKVLFWMLRAAPSLILESEVEGDFLNVRLAYWSSQQENYYYKTLLKLPYKSLLEESAKNRARTWKNTRNRLLALGKNAEQVKRLGGDNAINLAILEEAEALQSAGIALGELRFLYQLNRKDWEDLCQLLGICYCSIAGWVVDLHYLVKDDIPPRFPEWLPQLIQEASGLPSFQSAIQATISIYPQILEEIGKNCPETIPELTLQLTRSSIHLGDRDLAKEQISYSLARWLQLHQLSRLEDLQESEAIPPTMTGRDINYLKTLKSCLSDIGDEWGGVRLEELFKAIAQQGNNHQLNRQTSFVLSHTFTKWEEDPPSKGGVSPISAADKVAFLGISADGKYLVSSGNDKTVELWQHERKSWQPYVSQTLTGQEGKVLAFALNWDGQILVSSEKTQQRSYIKIWNLLTGKLQRTLLGHKQPIRALAISPWENGSDRYFIASGSHKIKLWDLHTGESFQTLFGHRAWVYAIALSADGQFLLSGSEDRSIRIWRLPTGELIRTLTGHQGSVRALAIAPDGRRFVSGSDDGTIKLWDLPAGKLLHTFTGHSGAVNAVALSPHGQHLISGSEDKTIQIWDFQTGKRLQTLAGHRRAVRAIAVSPDGQTLASCSEDKTIRIWQAKLDILCDNELRSAIAAS
ncbi:MAG: WD40 repeat domain-containing protein [Hydrococcus sp. C42_A2020_068]|nr:WD40 repeat domain-containing protein [Hydrococcus sp. C42_A2020_068]